MLVLSTQWLRSVIYFSAETLETPASLALLALWSYLAAWQDDRYWLSTTDLYFICSVCGPCIEIYQHEIYQDEDGEDGEMRTIFTKLPCTCLDTIDLTEPQDNADISTDVVRVVLSPDPITYIGHFSRLLSVQHWSEIDQGDYDSDLEGSKGSSVSSDSSKESVQDSGKSLTSGNQPKLPAPKAAEDENVDTDIKSLSEASDGVDFNEVEVDPLNFSDT